MRATEHKLRVAITGHARLDQRVVRWRAERGVIPVKIAIATCAALPPQFDDDRRLTDALAARGADARHAVWDDSAVTWDEFDRIVIRTTWDYPHKYAAFLSWADELDGRLENPPRVVRWNSDKHHVADLIAAGIPTVSTRFVEPGDALPALDGEVVVKPAISAGGRLTGRFDCRRGR